jgi:hypothetical protein
VKISPKLAEAVLKLSPPNTPEELESRKQAFMAQHQLSAQVAEGYKNTHWGKTVYPLHIDSSKNGETIPQWTFNLPGRFNFVLMYYPACCGAMIVHHFHQSENFTASQENFNAVLDAIFEQFHDIMWFRNRRILTVMVERDSSRIKDKNRFSEIPVIDNPEVDHPIFWKYWHSKAKVTDRLMYNENSTYILHELEVIIN